MPSYLSNEDLPQVTKDTIAFMERAFWYIEAGQRYYWMYNPGGKRYSKEKVDKVIADIDKFFEEELTRNAGYWAHCDATKMVNGSLVEGTPIDTSPEFNRLKGTAREAFVQSLMEIVKNYEILPWEVYFD